MYQSETKPWLEFYAWNDDGSAKDDLVYNTAGISLKVQRDNLADMAAMSLSAASSPTNWAAGKLYPMGGNKYRVGIATSAISTHTGKISVGGGFTSGVVTGTTEVVTAYDPSTQPNTVTPPAPLTPPSAVSIAAEVWGSSTRTLTEIIDSSGITTLLGRITALVQTKTQSEADTSTIMTKLDDITSAAAQGPGNLDMPITVKGVSGAESGVEVWVTSDLRGDTIVAGTLITPASGIVTFKLFAGTYYVWCYKAGLDFGNPTEFTVGP